MQQVVTDPRPVFGFGYLMPTPGPLGRLVRRRRGELGLTQPQLSDLTEEQYGVRVPQNLISRLESGRTHRVNDIERLAVLGKTLGFEGHEDFVMAAYAPGAIRETRADYGLSHLDVIIPGPHGELVALVRSLPDRDAVYLLRIARAMVQQDQPES